MSNACQQCARSRLKDNSQMLKIKNHFFFNLPLKQFYKFKLQLHDIAFFTESADK